MFKAWGMANFRPTRDVDLLGHAWFVQAPLVIAVCAISWEAGVEEGDRFNYRMIDAAIVADHLILAAANLGLGTCWIAAFNVEAARSVLRLPLMPSLSSLHHSDIQPTSLDQKPVNR